MSLLHLTASSPLDKPSAICDVLKKMHPSAKLSTHCQKDGFMPELPEVETIVRQLYASQLIGSKILKLQVLWPRSIATPDLDSFGQMLIGQTILHISRRGKFIVFTLDGSTLLVHLRMTGKFKLNKEHSLLPHERVQLQLSGGKVLHFEDQRKFGKWYLYSYPEAKLSELGLEPLSEEFTLKAFKEMLTKGKTQIKPFLLNQKHIVGLGNIYVDEALWAAKIAPNRKIDTLTQSEINALHKAIPHVLEQGIANMGTSLGSHQSNYFSVSGRKGFHQTHLKVFRRDGLPCPRCQTTIVKIKLAQRGTHYCPGCQQ